MLRSERGQSLVELALVMMFFLIPLFGGMVDFGFAFHHYIVIANAAREGARWGSRFPADDPGIDKAAIDEAANNGVTLNGAMITPSFPTGRVTGHPIRVRIEYPFSPPIMSALIGSFNINTQTDMIIYDIDPV